MKLFERMTETEMEIDIFCLATSIAAMFLIIALRLAGSMM